MHASLQTTHSLRLCLLAHWASSEINIAAVVIIQALFRAQALSSFFTFSVCIDRMKSYHHRIVRFIHTTPAWLWINSSFPFISRLSLLASLHQPLSYIIGWRSGFDIGACCLHSELIFAVWVIFSSQSLIKTELCKNLIPKWNPFRNESLLLWNWLEARCCQFWWYCVSHCEWTQGKGFKTTITSDKSSVCVSNTKCGLISCSKSSPKRNCKNYKWTKSPAVALS